MATQKKSPEVRFDGFTEDWETDSFENLTKINQGLQISITNRFKKRIPQSHFYITNEFLKEGAKSEYYILNPPESVLCTNDDVLMTRTGNTGEVVTGVNGAFHNNFFKIKFDREKIDKDYLVYFLKNEATQSLILRLAGVSTIPDLNHNDFYQIEMPFPVDIKEQNKISQLLGNLDSLLKNHQTQLKKLTNLKKAMLIKMFPQDGASVPEIRFKGFDAEWEVKRLKDICDFSRGMGLSKNKVSKEGRFKCLLYGHLYTKYDMVAVEVNFYTNEILHNQVVSVKGDVLIPSSDTTPTGLARATCLELSDVILGGDINILRPQNIVNGSFLSYNLNANRGKLLPLIKGTTVRHLYNEDLKSITLHIPNDLKGEQQKIGNYFKNLDGLIDHHSTQLKKLNQIKKACLTKLFVSQD